jgi:thymidine kinase
MFKFESVHNLKFHATKLDEIPTNKYTECEYIIVDEGQFFEDLFDFVTTATDLNDKHVIVVGLNGDSNRENFGDIYKLYPLADKINLLTAMCIKCKNGTPGIFSKKIVNDTNQTDVGSTDKYIPVCRKCFNK